MNYYHHYKRVKNKYLSLKRNVVMDGGYIPDNNNSFKMIDANEYLKKSCLTEDSITLLSQFKKKNLNFDSKLIKYLKPFDKELIELINKIKNLAVYEEVSYKTELMNSVLHFIISSINVNELKNEEKKGAKQVNDYIRKTAFFKNKTNVIDKYSNFWFLASDVAIDLKENIDQIERFTKIKINGSEVTMPNLSTDKEKILVKELLMHKKIVKAFAESMGLSYQNPNVHFLLSNAKKKFPKKTDDVTFTTKGINSAEYSPRDNQLNIFRKEELSKLLFHELGHRAKFEHYIDDNSDLLLNWGKNWPIKREDNNNLLFTETITETIAQFLNIIVTAELCKTSNQNFDEVFNYLWKTELQFGIYQTAKILFISNFNSAKELVQKPFQNYIKESTSAVEYHIFKTILMLNFNEFWFKYNKGDIQGVLELITRVSNDQEYINMVDSILNSLTPNDDSFLFRTGRMTIIERYIL